MEFKTVESCLTSLRTRFSQSHENCQFSIEVSAGLGDYLDFIDLLYESHDIWEYVASYYFLFSVLN